MTTRNFAIAALAAVLIGSAWPLAVWAASNQTQTATSKQRARHPQPVQSQHKSVPQNSCDYDRAAGNCMIDLGYGRCMSCDAGPAK